MVICWKDGVVSSKSKFIFYAKFWFQKIHSKAKITVASLPKLWESGGHMSEIYMTRQLQKTAPLKTQKYPKLKTHQTQKHPNREMPKLKNEPKLKYKAHGT